MKISFLLVGHSFRQGGQNERNLDSNSQTSPSASHMNFVNELRLKGHHVDIFCVTYHHEYSNELFRLYPGASISLVEPSPLIQQGDMLLKGINAISDLNAYDYLIRCRFDMQFKNPIELASRFLEVYQQYSLIFPFGLFWPRHAGEYEFETYPQHVQIERANAPRIVDTFYCVSKNMFHTMTQECIGRTTNHAFLTRICSRFPDFDTDKEVGFLVRQYSDTDSAKMKNDVYLLASRQESNIGPFPRPCVGDYPSLDY